MPAISDSKVLQAARAFLGLKDNLAIIEKALDQGALRDVETIESGVDGHGREGVPSAAEITSGPAQAMRGGQADTQIAAHSDLKPQEGNTKDYIELANRLSGMEKSLATLASTVKSSLSATGVLKGALDALLKADDEEKDEDKDEMSKALRKARIAIRKAESDDEDEDTVEKAQAALASLNTVIGKAEDEADDDDKEQAAEKARTDYRALKGKLKARVEAVAAKAKPVEAPAAAPVPETAKSEPVAKSIAALQAQIDALQGRAASESVASAPALIKAVQEGDLSAISSRISIAEDEGTLSDHEISKAHSILNRAYAARNGKYDFTLVTREIESSPASVKRIFTSVAA